MPRLREAARRRCAPGPAARWLRGRACGAGARWLRDCASGRAAPWLVGLGLLLLAVAAAAQPADEAAPPAAGGDGPGEEAPEAPPVDYSSPYDAWDAGAYGQALRGFADRQTERPDDPELSLNVGAAHYKLKDFEAANGQFYRAAAIGDDELRARALYNLGNSAYRQDQIEDAVDFYRASLEANPDDLDAKFNLEFVREEMRQRQQQNRGGQDRQQDQQDQDQDQQDQDGQGGQQQPEDSDRSEGEQPSGQQDPGERGQDDRSQGEEDPRDGDGDDSPDAPQPQADGQESGSRDGPRDPPPGMTPEEAERYLQALEEGRPDPTRRGQRGRRSRQAKDW